MMLQIVNRLGNLKHGRFLIFQWKETMLAKGSIRQRSSSKFEDLEVGLNRSDADFIKFLVDSPAVQRGSCLQTCEQWSRKALPVEPRVLFLSLRVQVFRVQCANNQSPAVDQSRRKAEFLQAKRKQLCAEDGSLVHLFLS